MGNKKIGIVSMSLDKWELNEIYLNVRKKGFDVKVINSNFAIDYSGKQGDLRYHSILGRVERPILHEGISILKALENQGHTIYNTAEAILNGQNKFYTSMMLTTSGIPHPKTICGFSADSLIPKLSELCFPIVIKPWIGGRGVGVVKAENKDAAISIFETLECNNQPIYIQEFVQIPGKGVPCDMRVFVVKDEPLGVFLRQAPKGKWKTNICNGGIIKTCKLTPTIGELAVRAVKAIKADIAGVDIMETDKGYKVIEVNICPLFKGFYEATRINPAEKIASSLCSIY